MAFDDAAVRMQWGGRIPLRDGVHLSATVYVPKQQPAPRPAILLMTPYVAQTSHDRGVYFASHGYPFVIVDVRGRGNSEGEFRPLANEADDSAEVIEWVAQQSYCNGQVAMWGGSYSGYVQWAAAKRHPPQLATIVPAAAPCAGVDFPGRNNILKTYLAQWLALVWGRTSQDKLFWQNERYWGSLFREWFESGTPYEQLDAFLGIPSTALHEWLEHPHWDEYWDEYNPTARQYAAMSFPVLTITGIYDGDQPGALAHYRQHLQNLVPASRSRHYLVIGPWDHAGTRTPVLEFCGLKVGAASRIDLGQLHLQWYAWVMEGGPKPEFLRNNVAYYMMVADEWRYSDSLEAITQRYQRLYLTSDHNPTDVFKSGRLTAGGAEGGPDRYVYDPRDTSLAELESTVDPQSRTDQRMTHACAGKLLIYHSAPFAEDVEVGGFFRMSAWIAIDQADTDFRVTIYEIGIDGTATQLSMDLMRARYRESPRQPKLIRTTEPLQYSFESFTFVARTIRAGCRLRLVFESLNSIYYQKNYNSGGAVSKETLADARPVTVTLFHDTHHPSALELPIAG